MGAAPTAAFFIAAIAASIVYYALVSMLYANSEVRKRRPRRQSFRDIVSRAYSQLRGP